MILIVPPHEVDAIWPRISKRIGACIDRFGGDASAGDLWTMCRAGHVYLMICIEGDEVKGASLWRYETWTDGVVLKNLITVGDDMESWFAYMDASARDLAVCGGATSYAWSGREGWKRFLKDRTMTCQTLYRMEI